MIEFISVWRKLARKEGIGDFYFVGHDFACRNRKQIIDKMRSLSNRVFSKEEDKSNGEWFEHMVIGQLDYYLNGVNTLFTEDGKSQEDKSINSAKIV